MSKERYYAKSQRKDGTQETVQEHLQAVETLASTYGKSFGQEIPAGLCGLFHDFGKYSPDFQNVLKRTQTGIDHAISGAAFLYFHRNAYSNPTLLRPIIEAIAAHHSHLISQEDMAYALADVVQKSYPVPTPCGKQASLRGVDAYHTAYTAFQSDFPDFRLPKKRAFLSPGPSQEGSMLYTRMLFSCLVDADYTASSTHPVEDGAALDTAAALKNLYDYCQTLRAKSGADAVLNTFRDQLFQRCGQAGEQDGGLFTLTAPTGTGKTLALLHFALRHCQHTGKRRIIVVLPFLSLIEQSAEIYRKIIPDVIEDHSQSNLSEEMREHAARWNQPFIITTSVRFFEALFANQPGDCRKLHNLSNSVILFDEAQSLPISLLSPTLKSVQELCERYQCSMVFSTATQPDYTGLRDITWPAVELLPEYQQFYQALRRTQVVWQIDEPTPLENIADQMAESQNVCTIVNLRDHARKLYQELKIRCPQEEIFLLSTDLCPAHRTKVIQTIHNRQKNNLPCRVVSTQCIEAGVDLDFDQLYRALAPLEAIIQAAGRCNRNGGTNSGHVCVFIPNETHRYPDSHYEHGAIVVGTMHAHQPIDIHDPECIRTYYTQLFGAFRGDTKSQALKNAIEERDFCKVSQTYRLIDQQGFQIIVPYQECSELFSKIRSEALQTGLTKSLLRQAAPLTITCYDQELVEHTCERLYFAGTQRQESRESSYFVLLSGQEDCYDIHMGFCPPTEQTAQNLLL